MASATLEFYSSEFSSTKLTSYAVVGALLQSWSMVANKFYDETFCSTMPTAPTLTTGSVSSDLCFWWDGKMREFPFNPITSACTDAG